MKDHFNASQYQVLKPIYIKCLKFKANNNKQLTNKEVIKGVLNEIEEINRANDDSFNLVDMEKALDDKKFIETE